MTVGNKTSQTGPDARACTITGLRGNTWYDTSVVALSSVGPSAPRTGRFQTTPLPSVPKRPAVNVKASAVSGASKLKVGVDPVRRSGYWTFKVQKKRGDETWKTAGTYKLKANKRTRTINLRRAPTGSSLSRSKATAETP